MSGGLACGLALIGLGTGLVAGDPGRLHAPGPTAGVVLHELHSLSPGVMSDTLTTYLMPGRVRVSHHDGDALLDVTRDRFVLLSPHDKTYRAMALSAWEAKIDEALVVGRRHRRGGSGDRPDTLAADSVATDSLAFEAEAGRDTIAGFACERWHLFTPREVFPGEFEAVEEEIWVTRELELTPETWHTYRRVLASLDRIELDAAVTRPAGVAMRTVLRRRPQGRPPTEGEVETTEVIAVERRASPESVFAIPLGYARADSGAVEGATGH